MRVGPTSNHSEIRQWAEGIGALPIEIVPYHFNGDPPLIDFAFSKEVARHPEFKLISWEAFFAHFDLLGLTFVYDDSSPDRYEILRDESQSPEGGGSSVH